MASAAGLRVAFEAMLERSGAGAATGTAGDSKKEFFVAWAQVAAPRKFARLSACGPGQRRRLGVEKQAHAERRLSAESLRLLPVPPDC